MCYVNVMANGQYRFGVSDLVFRVKKALGAECGLAIGEPVQRLLLQLQARGRSAVIRVIMFTLFC